MGVSRCCVGALLLHAMGCGHAPARPVATPSSPPAHVRLAILPVEGQGLSSVAQALHDAMIHAKVADASETFVSKVPLEVAQLAIECVEPSPACYAAVGNSLSAQLLLFADLGWVKDKNARRVQLTVTLFDVAAATVRSQRQRTWSTEAAARTQCARLVDELVHPSLAARASSDR